jgi:hypothetical protein
MSGPELRSASFPGGDGDAAELFSVNSEALPPENLEPQDHERSGQDRTAEHYAERY